MTPMKRVFFSYASEDRPRLNAYVSAFQKVGIEVLLDYQQIGAGLSIPEKINEMIKSSDAAVLFYSEAYARKSWTKEEQNALQFCLVERKDYQLVAVRLDPIELPPLLAHRLWVKEGDVFALASVFSSDLRVTFSGNGAGSEISDWLQTFPDDELERMASAIQAELRLHPSVAIVPWRAKKAGAIAIHLSQPLLPHFTDNLAFVLRMLEKVDFIRRRLRERITDAGLGIFEGSFMLAEQERFRQIEDFRRELKENLGALVERLTLAKG
jgi:TIR domain